MATKSRTADIARSASGVDIGFPYKAGHVCYFERFADGHIESVDKRKPWGDRMERLRSGSSTLFGAWPGEWRTDLFVIDDLDEVEKELFRR